MKPKKKQKKLRITEADFMLANRRAARLEEIAEHGRPVSFQKAVYQSKKVYDWKRLKRMEQKLIRIVRENPTISKINLAGEFGIGRSTLYRLLIKLEHKVRSTGGTRH